MRAARTRRVIKYCRQHLIRKGHGDEPKLIRDELTELERLAAIGKATEKAFNKNYNLSCLEYDPEEDEVEVVGNIFSISGLLRWAESESE